MNTAHTHRFSSLHRLFSPRFCAAAAAVGRRRRRVVAVQCECEVVPRAAPRIFAEELRAAAEVLNGLQREVGEDVLAERQLRARRTGTGTVSVCMNVCVCVLQRGQGTHWFVHRHMSCAQTCHAHGVHARMTANASVYASRHRYVPTRNASAGIPGSGRLPRWCR